MSDILPFKIVPKSDNGTRAFNERDEMLVKELEETLALVKAGKIDFLFMCLLEQADVPTHSCVRGGQDLTPYDALSICGAVDKMKLSFMEDIDRADDD